MPDCISSTRSCEPMVVSLRIEFALFIALFLPFPHGLQKTFVSRSQKVHTALVAAPPPWQLDEDP